MQVGKKANLLLFLSILFSTSLLAATKTETINLIDNTFYLSEGQTKSVRLPERKHRFVKNIVIQAEARIDGTFQIIANGVVKGTVYVPGRDPSYIVTIEESVSSLEFQHIRGGTASILSVKAVLKDDKKEETTEGSETTATTEGPGKSAISIANRVIAICDDLGRHLDPKTELVQYVLPIKNKAIRLRSAAMADGDDLSREIIRRLEDLHKEIKLADALFDSLLNKKSTEAIAERMLKITREIFKRLND